MWTLTFSEWKVETIIRYLKEFVNFLNGLTLRQYIQEGRHVSSETVIKWANQMRVTIPETEEDLDGLGYFTR